MLAHTQGVCDQAGRVVRVVGTNQDITKAKQAEQERQRLLGRLYEVLDGQDQRLAADLHDGHMQAWPPSPCGSTRPPSAWTGATSPWSAGSCGTSGSRSATSWPRCGAPSPRCCR